MLKLTAFFLVWADSNAELLQNIERKEVEMKILHGKLVSSAGSFLFFLQQSRITVLPRRVFMIYLFAFRFQNLCDVSRE